MEALGIMLFLLLIWVWTWPESFGRWLANVHAGYDAIRTPSTGEDR